LKVKLKPEVNFALLACLMGMAQPIVYCSVGLFAQPALAWPGKKKAETAAPANKPSLPAPQAPAAEAPAKDPAVAPPLTQTDRSANLTYILPDGWLATQNPFYGHDLLVKKTLPNKGSLVIADREGKGGMERVSKALEEELAKQCQDFKLVSNETTQLASGVSCVKLISTGKVVNYLMPYIHGRVLHITGTFTRGDDAGLATCDQFASSIKVKKAKGLL